MLVVDLVSAITKFVRITSMANCGIARYLICLINFKAIKFIIETA